MAQTHTTSESLKRVSLHRATHLQKQVGFQKHQKSILFRNRRGDLFPVTFISKQNGGPNWRLVLADGRDFLVDPSTLLEVAA
jgi:hypothetical protein